VVHSQHNSRLSHSTVAPNDANFTQKQTYYPTTNQLPNNKPTTQQQTYYPTSTQLPNNKPTPTHFTLLAFCKCGGGIVVIFLFIIFNFILLN
jgi:hypothetical protein